MPGKAKLLRIGLLKAVALERTPALIAKALVFPQTRKAGFGQLGAGDEDPVGVAAEEPPAALKPSCCAGAKLKPTRIRCCRLSSSKKCPRAKISRVCERCTGAHIQSYCTRRKHSCPIALAPRYSRAFFSGGSACSVSALMATLIGSSDRCALLKSSTARHNGEAASLVFDFRVMPFLLRSRAAATTRCQGRHRRV